MALTEKGANALNYIKTYFPSKSFSAKDLSNACGEKIVAATLNGVANNGYILKLGGSPVMYQAVDDLEELLTAALAEQNSNELKTKVANLESRVAALEAAKTSTTSETT